MPILFFETEDEKKSFIKYAKEQEQEVLESEFGEFIKLMYNANSFNEKNNSYIKSYILYQHWKSNNNWHINYVKVDNFVILK